MSNISEDNETLLDLSNKFLSDLFSELNRAESLQRITHFYCANNYIQTLPNIMEDMVSLKVLDLSGCDFLILSNALPILSRISTLSELWISGGRDELVNVAHSLENLKYINGYEIQRIISKGEVETFICANKAKSFPSRPKPVENHSLSINEIVDDSLSLELYELDNTNFNFYELEDKLTNTAIEGCKLVEMASALYYGSRPFTSGFSKIIESSRNNMGKRRCDLAPLVFAKGTAKEAYEVWDIQEPDKNIDNSSLCTYRYCAIGDIPSAVNETMKKVITYFKPTNSPNKDNSMINPENSGSSFQDSKALSINIEDVRINGEKEPIDIVQALAKLMNEAESDWTDVSRAILQYSLAQNGD